jgi:urease accessory protein
MKAASRMNVPEILPATLPVESGHARLEVEVVFRESTATTAWASSPLKLLVPCSRGPSVWACTSSFGGGLVAGDRTRLDVRLGPGARCFIGTQSSTKVYRNPSSLPCGHVTRSVLETGSLLVFAPDPVQAFADSQYTQRQEFHLAPEAGLALMDWFTSGRAARGERWAFKHFQSRNEIFVDGKCAVLDSVRLNSGDGDLNEPHRMGRFNCLAALFFIGAPLRSAAEELLKQNSAQPVARRGNLVTSASPLRDGAVLRVAGENTESVGRELQRHLAFVADLLGDDPWSRKF